MAADRAASTTSRAAVPVAPAPAPATGATRGGDDMASVVARDGEDVVELTVINGPTLVLSPQSAADLLRAQAPAGTRGAVETTDAGALVVKAQLGWPGLEAAASRGATRGWMGEVALSAFKVLTGFQADAATLVAALVDEEDRRRGGRGRLQAAARLAARGLHEGRDPRRRGGAGARRRPAAGARARHLRRHGQHLRQAVELQPDNVRTLFDALRRSRLCARPPDDGREPDRATRWRWCAQCPRARGCTCSPIRAAGWWPRCWRAPAAAMRWATTNSALFAADAYASSARTEGAGEPRRRQGPEGRAHGARGLPGARHTLASKRLDAYLSVLQWGLKLAGVPVAPELVDFLHEVARRRADPAQLPGLEAMMPESALVKWLDCGERQPIPGDLRVVAGDMQGDSIGSWVKTLLADAFYWTDNDLVVQTRLDVRRRAARAGAAAAARASCSTAAPRSTHFNYFANARTVRGIVDALTENAPPANSRAIGPLSWAARSERTRAARGARSRGARRPRRRSARRCSCCPASSARISRSTAGASGWACASSTACCSSPGTRRPRRASSPTARSARYEDLIERLADTHEVIPFAFDWRAPDRGRGARLAAAVDAALDARTASGQPVRILAHSMGGLVARTLQLETPETWKRMMARDGARLLMLGTPNGGSWAPMQIALGRRHLRQRAGRRSARCSTTAARAR